MEEFHANGIDIADYPLFLIEGMLDTSNANALMQASGLKLIIKPTESGSQPLLWYAAEKDGDLAIFLFLCSCCQTSLMSGGRGLEQEKAVAGNRGDAAVYGSLVQADDEQPGFNNPLHSIQPVQNRGRQVSNQSLQSLGSDNYDEDSKSGKGRTAVGQQTIGDDEPRSHAPVSRPVSSSLRLQKKASETAKAELGHVCHLLRNARQPYIPCNGLISTIPFEMLRVDGNGQQGKNLGEVTRSDLKVLTEELGLRVHVLALVHGLDADEDFRVFIKRMRDFQTAADVDRRLGKGLSAWAEGGAEMIESVADCSCDAFQRLIYKFLSSTHSLRKVDNGQLFRFLAKIRGKVVGNLKEWLVEGFAPREENNGQPIDLIELPQFAGCYFVAAQPLPPEVNNEEPLFAHVPGVFERLFELEGEIEWSPAAAANDMAYRFWANAFFLLTLAAILTIVIGLFGSVSRLFTP